jgi:hypothetical protein
MRSHTNFTTSSGRQTLTLCRLSQRVSNLPIDTALGFIDALLRGASLEAVDLYKHRTPTECQAPQWGVMNHIRALAELLLQVLV